MDFEYMLVNILQYIIMHEQSNSSTLQLELSDMQISRIELWYFLIRDGWVCVLQYP